jgi:chemotaxis protein CheC
VTPGPALGAGQLDALREVGNIGAGTAATALSTMIGAPVAMEVPRAEVLPVERIPEEVGGGDAVAVAVLLGVTGEAPGHMLLTMGLASARAIVAVLLGCPAGDPEDPGFDEMELSALQEVGNILTSAYLGAMSALTGLRLEPTPPALGVDLADALLGSALAQVAGEAETALLIETRIGGIGPEQLGRFLFLTEPGALAVVLDRLGVGG